MQRAGLRLPLRLLHLLNDEERSEVLVQLGHFPIADVMNKEPHSVYEGSTIPHALVKMIEWSYEQIPVVSREGAFVGLLDRDAVLSTVVKSSSSQSQVKDAAPPTPVRLVMQAVVPHVELGKPLHSALQQVLTSSSRYLVVVDDNQYVRGSLSDASILQFLSGSDRVAWLTALQHQGHVNASDLPQAGYNVEAMMEQDIPMLPPDISITEAVGRLLEHKQERATVVDEAGKLLGILGRNGLLRALLQESH
jgi:CBS-domain-containing membrane protein